MLLNPSFYADFMNDYGYLDPRVTFSRASTGTYCDRNGILRTRSASNPRFGFSPLSGYPVGMRCEAAFTNLLTWSEDFTNVGWNRSAVTVTANAAAAPDGSTNADLATATGPSPFITQANITITAGNVLTFSVFAQKAATNFLCLNVSDGTNSPTAWFDLNLGVVTSHSGGGGTCVYQAANIEAWPNGWYRCAIVASTTTITTVQAGIHPTHVDGSLGVSGDAVNIWGAQLTQLVATVQGSRSCSYISTAAAAVTRAAESGVYLTVPDATWFDPNQGTFFIDFSLPVGCGASSVWTCGSGAGSGDQIFIGYTARTDMTGLLQIQAPIYAGGTVVSDPIDSITPVVDQSIRCALAYSRGVAPVLCVNGRTPVPGVIPPAWPATPTKVFAIGSIFGPGGVDTHRFAYFPRQLTNAQLIDLTT